MATNYPNSLDNFTNPTSASPINSPSHSEQHANANDAIEAIEGELGTSPKGTKTTVKARLDDVDTAIATKAPIASPTFTGTVTIPAGSAITGVPYLNAANTFSVSPQQITIDNAANKGLIVKGAVSQSANLQEWQNSSGTVIASIISTGGFRNTVDSVFGAIFVPYISVGAGYAFTSGTAVYVLPGNTSTIGQIIRGRPSQTADLQQWQNSAGTVLARVSNTGIFVGGSFSSDGSQEAGTNIASQFGSTSATRIPMVVYGAASQTANLQEWRNSSGNVLAAINSVGQFFTGLTPIYSNVSTTTAASGNGSTATITTTSAHNISVGDYILVLGITPAGYNGTYQVTAVPTSTQISYANTTTGSQTVAGSITISAQASIIARSNMSVGLTVKAGANAPAQTWQNSSGAQVARVDNTGNIVVADVIANNLIAPFGYATIGTSYSRFSTAMISVKSTTAESPGIIIRGAASQTANLQEWQDSAGTVLSSISSSGNFSAKGLSVSSVTNTTNAGTFYNAAGTIVFNVDTSLNQVNIGGGLSGIANNFGSSWGYDSSTNAGFITFQTGALGGDSLAMRRTNFISSGDYTISTIGNMRLSVASGKNFNFNNGNVMIATTASGTNNKIIVNPYTAVDNLATVQINTNAVTNKGLVVQGIASQTANLQEWQSSNGNIVARVKPDGLIESYAGLYSYTLGSSNDGSLVATMGSNGNISFSGTVTAPTIKSSVSSTISVNTATTVDTVAISSFTTIEYTISIKQDSKVRSSKVLVHTDGTSIDSTEYGIMEMGGGITGILVTASVSSTNSILQVTITDAATTNATVKLIKTML